MELKWKLRKQEKDKMSQYRFQINENNHHVSFQKQLEEAENHWDNVIVVFGEDIDDELNKLYFTSSVPTQTYEPSTNFWVTVVDMFRILSNLNLVLNRAEEQNVRSYIEVTSSPYSRTLPKYEAKTASEIYNWMLTEHIEENYPHVGVLPEAVYKIVLKAHQEVNKSEEYDDVEAVVPLVNRDAP